MFLNECKNVLRCPINEKLLRFMAALSVTIAILLFLFSKIEMSHVVALLKTAHPSWLIAVVFVLNLNLVLDACRWRMILQRLHQNISFKEAFLIKVAANLLISVLPFRSGELSRLLVLKRSKNTPYVKTTISIMVEYMHKIFILVLYIFIGAVLCRGDAAPNRGIVLLSLPLFFIPFCSIRPGIPAAGEITGYLRVFQDHWAELKNLLTDRKIFLCNLLYTSTDFVNFFILSKSLSVHIPWPAILFFLPMVLFASCLPFTVAGIGARELAVLFFFRPYAPPELLLSLGLLYSLVEFILPSLIGILMMTIFSGEFLKLLPGKHKS